jgi:hypothetical protein
VSDKYAFSDAETPPQASPVLLSHRGGCAADSARPRRIL